MELNATLKLLIVLFIISVVIWLILLIYRSRLEQSGAEAFRTTPERMTEEQKKKLQKVDRMSIPMWIFGILSIIFLLCSVAYWIYLGLMG